MKQQKLFFLISILILLTFNLFCAEFVADLIKKGEGIKSLSKIYVKNNKVRIDTEMQGQKNIMLNDYENKKFIILQPSAKIYISINLKNDIDFSDPEFKKNIEEIANVKLIGQETINGYKCDKYLYTYHNKNLGKLTAWYSKKLNYLIKSIYESSSLIEIELTNIKEKKLDTTLFEIPQGYKKMM